MFLKGYVDLMIFFPAPRQPALPEYGKMIFSLIYWLRYWNFVRIAVLDETYILS